MTGQNQKRNNTSLFHFITIFICAKQTACLVHENVAVEPTMSEHPSDVPSIIRACGDNTTYCMDLCKLCNELFPGEKMNCLFQMLHHVCLKPFNTKMNHSDADWCDWGNMSGLYSNLSLCTEKIYDCLGFPWPDRLVEEIFLDIHSQYFQDCPSEELSDPPPPIVFALVITPICLIPIMVSLVVLKTKNGDGSP